MVAAASCCECMILWGIIELGTTVSPARWNKDEFACSKWNVYNFLLLVVVVNSSAMGLVLGHGALFIAAVGNKKDSPDR